MNKKELIAAIMNNENEISPKKNPMLFRLFDDIQLMLNSKDQSEHTAPVPAVSSTQEITYSIHPDYRKYLYQGSPQWDEIVSDNQTEYVPKDEMLDLKKIIIRRTVSKVNEYIYNDQVNRLQLEFYDCSPGLAYDLNQSVYVRNYAQSISLPNKKSINLIIQLNTVPRAGVILDDVFNAIQTWIPHFEAIIPKLKTKLYTFGYKEEKYVRDAIFSNVEIETDCSLRFGSFKEIETNETKTTQAVFSRDWLRLDIFKSVSKNTLSPVKQIITIHEDKRVSGRDFFSEEVEISESLDIWFDTEEHARIYYSELCALTKKTGPNFQYSMPSMVERCGEMIKINGLPGIIDALNLLHNDNMLRVFIEDHVKVARLPITFNHTPVATSISSNDEESSLNSLASASLR